jgi:hypothetical protein
MTYMRRKNFIVTLLIKVRGFVRRYCDGVDPFHPAGTQITWDNKTKWTAVIS